MNDEPIKLRPANENPWYVLATYHGEQKEGHIDDDLHAKNREVWNRWIATTLSHDDRQKLIDEERATAANMKPFSAEERRELWAGCRSPDLPTPDPATGINFSDTLFARHVSFAQFIFPAKGMFSRAKFLGNANFEHVVFKRVVFFRHTTFQKYTCFDHATFQEYVYFRHTTFQDYTDLEHAVFQEFADFQHVMFQGYATFRHATFHWNAKFEHTAFQETANFEQAAFRGNANFNNSVKRGDTAKFRQFSGPANFDNATFSGSADFTNREFLDRTLFNNAKFLNQAPVFAETKLHEGTTWHGVQWPETPDDAAEARNMADAYSHLRRRSNAIQDHEAELDFYSRELRAKRAATGGATGFLITLYELSCGFGASVGLPFYWLLGLWASGPPFYRALLRLLGAAEIDGLTLYGFSLASVGGFFGMRKEFFSDDMTDLPGTVLALSGIQSLLGAVFVFLLGLSLRNRFRIK